MLLRSLSMCGRQEKATFVTLFIHLGNTGAQYPPEPPKKTSQTLSILDRLQYCCVTSPPLKNSTSSLMNFVTLKIEKPDLKCKPQGTTTTTEYSSMYFWTPLNGKGDAKQMGSWQQQLPREATKKEQAKLPHIQEPSKTF